MITEHGSSKIFDKLSTDERISNAKDQYKDGLIMSTSFGIQSAVMLHLVKQHLSDIPIIFIDTGYLFQETYSYAQLLTEQLDLNLKIFKPKISRMEQEKRYGKLWEQGKSGLEKYNQINKVEPMQRGLNELKATAWISGLRREQSESRKYRPVVEKQNNWIKIYPIIDWNEKQVESYIKEFNLPPHPLKSKGYVSVGDWHSSEPLRENMTAEETRFQGIKRECGLHLDFDQGGGI